MHFTGTKHLHEIENIMQEIPNFLSQGHGGTVLKKEMENCIRGQPPPDSYEEMMSALTAGIAYKLLGELVSRYLKESEGKAVSWNKKHKAVFQEIAAKMDKQNYALLSALYLLTADYRLWKIMDGIIQKYHPDWMACGDIPPNALPVGGQNRTPADRGERHRQAGKSKGGMLR